MAFTYIIDSQIFIIPKYANKLVITKRGSYSIRNYRRFRATIPIVHERTIAKPLAPILGQTATMTNYSKHLAQGDKVTSADLKAKWVETLSFYDQMIDGGHQLRPMRFLVKHIIEKGYDNYFFPGTSLFNLLISIPINGNVDYTKTLKVEIDQLTNIIKFDYRDYTGCLVLK